jgi:hypothetical protein
MTLQEIVEQLESCNYECEAGTLENNVAWRELKQIAEGKSPIHIPIHYDPIVPADEVWFRHNGQITRVINVGRD